MAKTKDTKSISRRLLRQFYLLYFLLIMTTDIEFIEAEL